MIRRACTDDYKKILSLWLRGASAAHPFIKEDYWTSNQDMVKNQLLPQAQTYVFCDKHQIKGFISLLEDNYIGALFVKQQEQRKGIGRKLINYCKEKYDKLELNVYDKNGNAIAFYMAMGFKNVGVQIDKDTGEKEYIMEWKRLEE